MGRPPPINLHQTIARGNFHCPKSRHSAFQRIDSAVCGRRLPAPDKLSRSLGINDRRFAAAQLFSTPPCRRLLQFRWPNRTPSAHIPPRSLAAAQRLHAIPKYRRVRHSILKCADRERVV
jgi:hypothetical protein